MDIKENVAKQTLFSLAFYSRHFYWLSQYLLYVVAVSVITSRSISYRGMGDIALGDRKHCNEW